MSTPTGENPSGLQDLESVARRARHVSDLDRLESMLVRREQEQWAPRLPRAAQLPPVAGLDPVDDRSDDGRSPPSLEPDDYLVPPEGIVLSRDRPRWPVRVLLAALCGLAIGYFVVAAGPWAPPSSGPQLASVEAKPAALPEPKRAPIRAQDDESETVSTTETSPPRAKAARGTKFPEREIIAMLQPDDPGVRALSPKEAVRTLPAEEIKLLTTQGEQFAEAGDFATARMLLQRAAEANDATAAMALGTTYDPTVLARLRAVGVDADLVKARFWYQKAVSLGSPDAKRRLELLANR
jgi:hypothetical protein